MINPPSTGISLFRVRARKASCLAVRQHGKQIFCEPRQLGRCTQALRRLKQRLGSQLEGAPMHGDRMLGAKVASATHGLLWVHVTGLMKPRLSGPAVGSNGDGSKVDGAECLTEVTKGMATITRVASKVKGGRLGGGRGGGAPPASGGSGGGRIARRGGFGQKPIQRRSLKHMHTLQQVP